MKTCEKFEMNLMNKKYSKTYLNVIINAFNPKK